MSITAIAGVGPTIQWEGRTFTVKGRTLGHYAQVEAEIIKRRGGNPLTMLAEAAKELKGDLAALNALASVISEHVTTWNSVTYRDHIQFGRSAYGEAFTIWLAIRHNDDSLSPEHVQHVVMERMQRDGADAYHWKEELLNAIDVASGIVPKSPGDSEGNAPSPQEKSTGG